MINKLVQLLKGQIALFCSFGRPDKDKWVFSSVQNREFNYNSKYLFLYVKKYFPHVHPYYVINDDKKRKILSEQYGAEYFIETKSFRGMRQALKAGVWFTSAGLPVYAIGIGRKHIVVNLWHGVPLKKIVLMEENISRLQKAYFKYVFSKNYCCVLTTSEKLIPIMAESFGIAKEKVKVWGQPRNDAIIEKHTEKGELHHLMRALPKYEKSILYAPTYRDGEAVRLFPFEDMDMERLQNYLEEHQLLLCLRTHIEETVNSARYVQGRIVSLNADIVDDVTEYLSAFDILITDYSSVYIDYLLLDRPIIFLPYDKEKYLEKRGMNFDYNTVTPGDKPECFQEFMEALHRALYQDSYGKRRQEVNVILNQVTEPCSQYICEKIYNMEGRQNEKSNNLWNL